MSDIERIGNKSVDERLDNLDERLGRIEEMIKNELSPVEISDEEAEKILKNFFKSLEYDEEYDEEAELAKFSSEGNNVDWTKADKEC